MERRSFLTFLATTPAIAVLAACGSGNESLPPAESTPDDPLESTPPTEPSITAPPVIDPPAPAAGRPILSLTYEGGFTTRSYAFRNPPYVTVTDDGRLLTIGSVEEPGPGSFLLGSQDERSISPAGVAALIDAADEAGLLDDVEYDADVNIADASTTMLVITVDGTTYTHAAYALDAGGFQPPADSSPVDSAGVGDRSALAAFVQMIATDIESVVGAAELGEVGPWVPDAYQFEAVPVDAVVDFGPDATVVPWPVADVVSLAEASTCIEASADEVGEAFRAATELTLFTEDDITYQVFARPAYPGRTCSD